MCYTHTFILFLGLMTYTMLSFAADSSSIKPIQNLKPMHQITQVDVKNAIPRGVTYTSDGHQILDQCPADHSLVDIQNASDRVYWGPPEAIIIYGNCTGFGCWCVGSPYNCCKWCDPPVLRIDKVKWQQRPTRNQSSALYENMPSVLSGARCAPIITKWV